MPQARSNPSVAKSPSAANTGAPAPQAHRSAQPRADLDIGLIYTYERAFLDRLLPQLRASGEGLRLRLILVDNASDDGVERWRGVFDGFTTPRNKRRLGYAANLNRILEHATAPYVLLLNSDMEFDAAEQCLDKMVRFMEAHPECGLSSCGVYHPDGKFAYPARRWQTPRVVVARRLGLGAGVVDHYLYRDRPPRDTFACDWVSGCFMLVRREAMEQIGRFDTRFGKYFEDVDICQRMRLAGWSVMYHGEARCVHFEQRASRQLLSRDAARHAWAYLKWLWKWRARPTPTRGASEGEQTTNTKQTTR
jgi:hypothetical protein